MPTIADIYQLALRYHQAGNLAQAEVLYRQVLQADSANADALCALGILLAAQNQLAQAAASYRQALLTDPNHADASNSLGQTLISLGQRAAGIECFRHALRVNPDHPDANNNLANSLVEDGELTRAEACYRKVVRGYPNQANAYFNLGSTLFHQGLFVEADGCLRQALTLENLHGPSRWYRCMIRLLHGDFASAWPDFEQRWTLSGMVPRSFSQPRWDGSPLEGKTVLVYFVFGEQGLGDTLQFLRYLPMVQRRGGNVLLECQEALAGLLQGALGVDQLIPVGAPMTSFDVHIPLMSLPALFDTTLVTIPASVPYLAADSKLVEYWGEQITEAVPAGSGLKIGVAWQGNPNHVRDRTRSVPLEHFGALTRVPKTTLISLQVGPATGQLGAVPFSVLDLGSGFDKNSLSDLAGALLNLDLAVTVDTAVAHLAGALGVPVWLVLPNVPDWRWLLERDDSPWYPTMRLFRQRQQDAWDEVFDRMATALASFSPGSKNRDHSAPGGD
jgi:tetratricopeptide (TPR) repeat protein